jgi:hypothetical protein
MSKKRFLSRVNYWALGAALFAAAVLMYCGGGVPLTAPTGAELSITANPRTIPVVNGVSTITVTGFKSAEDGGGPLTNGTQIFFTTNVGLIDERVEMREGVARASLQSNGRAGSAIVEARSGAGITATLAEPVLIGNAGNVNIRVQANPGTVTRPDYSADIVATVFDNDNNRLPDMPIVFSTTAGSLASQGSILTTNTNGQAFDRLTLEDEDSATVTASSGAAEGSVTVGRGVGPDPIVDNVFPGSGSPGQTLNVTITGQNFQPGATVSFGNGIFVSNVNYINSNQLTATITIDPNARIETSGRTVTVTNPDGGSGSKSDAFIITVAGAGPTPFITSITPPSSGLRDPNTVTLTLTGTNFQNGAIVGFTPGGIVVNNVTFNSATQLTVVIVIDVTVAGGQDFDVTVINPDGGQDTLPSGFTAS